ncbi:MAG: glycosyltransferase [Gemmataceae bacterium]|nr:glycosyltransferase [Gemmataceae bacterium]
MELSVIIPAYNREWSVGRTIESVFACGSDAEVIVVDDASTDRTAEVARGYGPRVKVFTQPNAGPAGARNTGFRRSTGEVIAFLDSDDVWLPGVVPDCLAFLRAHPEIDVLACEAVFGNEADGYKPLSPVTGRGKFHTLLTEQVAPGFFKLPRSPFVMMMIERMQVFLGATFIRRGALVGGDPFDPGLFGGEDYELCLRLAATKTCAFHDRPLAKYEKHGGGISTNQERMAREFALAVRSMVRRPELLTPPERRAAKAKYAQLGFWYGYLAYDRGDYPEARRRFAAAIRDGGVVGKSAPFWLASRLPAPVIRLLRRVKQGVRA